MKPATLFRKFGPLLAMALLLGGCGGGGGGGGDRVGYTVGGTVEGMSGTGLVLQLNGAHAYPVSANGAFVFDTRLADGASYSVTIQAQPASPEQVCTVTNGSGTLAGADITNVAVRCPWTKQLGAAGAYTYATGVATDAHGNVYVTGETNSSLDGNAQTGNRDLILVKYDAAGNKRYSRQLGAAGAYTYATGVATDASGNIYVVGYTSGGLDGNAQTGPRDLFLVKYDAAGNKRYSRQLGAAGAYTYATGVATDAHGNVYVTGETNSSLDGNAQTGNRDLILVKYDAAGNKLYSRQLGAAGTYTYATGVATDAHGNVYVTGSTNGGLDGNAQTGNPDLFLVKYDAAGNKRYSRQLGAAGASAYAYAVATDAHGNVYVTGETNSSLDGNAQTGNWDLILVKYDAAGNKLYSRQLGAAGTYTYATGVATDAHGNVYVTGSTNGGLDGNTLTGSNDLFLVKYDAAGEKLYSRQLGAAGADTEAYGVATDGHGHVYVAGETTGGLDGNTLTGSSDLFLVKYDATGTRQ